MFEYFFLLFSPTMTLQNFTKMIIKFFVDIIKILSTIYNSNIDRW